SGFVIVAIELVQFVPGEVDGIVLRRAGMGMRCSSGVRHGRLIERRKRLNIGIVRHDSPDVESEHASVRGGCRRRLVWRRKAGFSDAPDSRKFEPGLTE